MPPESEFDYEAPGLQEMCCAGKTTIKIQPCVRITRIGSVLCNGWQCFALVLQFHVISDHLPVQEHLFRSGT